jgi:hypothetical protein
MKLKTYILNLIFHTYKGDLCVTEFIFDTYNKTEPINVLGHNKLYILKR